MKRIALISATVSLALCLTSCFEEIENWYTNTRDYDGRFNVALTCEEYEDDNTVIEDLEEMMIYNSAANVENEIIIDTHIAGLPVKGKFNVTGNPAQFKGQKESVNIGYAFTLTGANGYYYFRSNGSIGTLPTAIADYEDMELDGVQIYARLSLESGKITPNGKKTIGGNTSDGVEVKVVLHSDYLIFECYKTPEASWAVPTKPEFAWRIQDGSREPAPEEDEWDEHWTLDGYRYTGFPEDLTETVPIVVK